MRGPRRGQAQRDARNRRMFERWADGATVRAVAHEFGLAATNAGTIISRQVYAYARLHLGARAVFTHSYGELRARVRDHAGGKQLAS